MIHADNPYDESILLIQHLKLDLFKELYEGLGIDYGETQNDLEYYNYLAENPLVFRTPGMGEGIEFDGGTGYFTDYSGPVDGSIGSKAFPQGKGKCMDPNGMYWPFYVFGMGRSPAISPGSAAPRRTGIECCKYAINTVLGYTKYGCRTIGDIICMYHGGKPNWEQFVQYYQSRAGINDASGRGFVASDEMFKRQVAYQQHLVEYVHMSNKTPISRSYNILFPLITFISRQEQGVNCEVACRQALNEMNIR